MEGSLNPVQLVFEGWLRTKVAFAGGSVAHHSSPSITSLLRSWFPSISQLNHNYILRINYVAQT